MAEYTDQECLQIENEAMYSEIKRLREENQQLRVALAKARGPEGELPERVAEWLLSKGYSVTKITY